MQGSDQQREERTEDCQRRPQTFDADVGRVRPHAASQRRQQRGGGPAKRGRVAQAAQPPPQSAQEYRFER